MKNLQTQLKEHDVNADLQATLLATAKACVDINALVRRGALSDIMGVADNINVQGEEQKKLDVISNDILKDVLAACPSVKGIASEEEDSFVAANEGGSYLVNFDPLDGSSNIDINAPVGTIFSIYKAEEGELTEAQFLQAGKYQAAAGYVLYGTATVMALSTGNGTQLYTMEPATGEFLQMDSACSISEDTKEFSINASNQRHWAPEMQSYISDLLAGEEGPREKNFNMRWLAAMVGDVHRVICRGGIFTYPWDKRDPNKPGKLRLMYEANPMAMLIEQAGGLACTDSGKILEVEPTAIHQRVPVILGSANEVRECLKYHNVTV